MKKFRKINSVKVGDKMFDPSKLSIGTKLILLPIFTKVFGFLKAMILLYK